jgi:hypothetical protein
MKKFNQLLILGTTLLLSAAALTGCSGSSALGATTAQTTSGETTTPQTDAGIIASETTGSNNRLNDILERGYIESRISLRTSSLILQRAVRTPTPVPISNLQSLSENPSASRSV